MMDQIVLSNGKVIEANRGIVGVDADGDLYEGYDCTLEPMANDDKVLLAKFMIQRWTAVLRSAALDELGKLDGELMAKGGS